MILFFPSWEPFWGSGKL